MSTRSITPNSSGVPAAAVADEAHGVRVVDEHHRLELLGEVADLVERRVGPVHREHPVGDDAHAPRPARPGGLELGPQVGHVGVLVAEPRRLAQPDAVDDRRVVELVGDDRVLGAEEHLEDTAVRVEARAVEDRRLHAEELRQPLLEQGVLGLGAADEAHRRHPETPLVQRCPARADDVGVVGEAEVVVGAEVERLATGRRDVGGLRGGQLALALVEPGLLDLLERGRELVLDCAVHVASSGVVGIASQPRPDPHPHVRVVAASVREQAQQPRTCGLIGACRASAWMVGRECPRSAPVEDDLAALARAGLGEGGLPVLRGIPAGDDRRHRGPQLRARTTSIEPMRYQVSNISRP